MANEEAIYKLADEVFGDGVFLMVHCPICKTWSTAVKIPAGEVNRMTSAGRPSLTWEEREQILTLRTQKKTYRQISRITGFSTSVLGKYILRKKVLIDAKKELHEALLFHLSTCNNSTE